MSIETLILIIAAVSAASAIFGFALSRGAEGRKLRLSRHEHDRLDAILATVPEPGPTLERSCELIQEDATEALGAAIAALLRVGDVLTLSGNLGAGKTTLSRGVLRALGVSGPVPSPTFTLVQHYETAALTVAHFDLYRLTDQEEIHELGFEDAYHEGAVMVEWPELLGPLTPVDRLEVHLTDSGTGRTARLVGCGDWASRLARLQC